MRITPLDVRKQEFRKGMRGLDTEEVYAFLATVADEYESVLNDNKALRERLLELDDKVQEYRTLEKTLRDTLLTAERVTVESKDNARREANIIIKEAQIEAEKALRDINTDAMKLRSQVQQLRSQRDAFLARIKVVAESHLTYIESSVEDFNREDDALSRLDVSEEQLADQPVDTRDVDQTVTPTNLFETVQEVASDPLVDTAPAPEPAAAPAPQPVVPASPVVEPAPAPQPMSPPNVPGATGVTLNSEVRTEPGGFRNAGLAGSIDPISVIIDRMKKGQEEILSAGSGAPGYPDIETPSVAQPVEPVEAPVAVATPPAEIPADVTQEFSLEEIRRELDAEENKDA